MSWVNASYARRSARVPAGSPGKHPIAQPRCETEDPVLAGAPGAAAPAAVGGSASASAAGADAAEHLAACHFAFSSGAPKPERSENEQNA